MKPSAAANGIAECVLAWVIENVSVRQLSLAEQLQARSEVARLQEVLPYSEAFGLRWEPPIGWERASRESRLIMRQANEFIADVRGL